MNTRVDYYDNQDLVHSDRTPKLAKVGHPNAARRTTSARRTHKGPAQVNGIHRRRRKRITW